MSPCHKINRSGASVALVLALVLIALPSLMNAQTAPAAPAPTVKMSSDDVPKAEFFIGYQWLNPGGNIPNPNFPGTFTPFPLPSIAQGFGTNLAFNFTRNIGLEGNYGGDWNRYAAINMATVGPKLTWRGDGVNFYVHTLVGLGRFSTRGIAPTNGVGAVLGGGMDLKIWPWLSWRVFEADYQLERVNLSSGVPIQYQDLLRQTFDGVRLQSGLVINIGGAPELPVSAACSVQPTEVMVGEPVHATIVASNFNPKHTITYTWATNGGKIEGKDTGASIDTAGMSAGSFTVTATATDAKAHKNNTASCSANFTVKPLNPPQISCSASPTSVQTGGTSTISCSCTSPDNVPVTVGGWTASGGSISGSGNTATLSTTGASAGNISIGATCTDSRGLTASASTSVTVENPPPPPPPAPQATKVNECEYPNVKKPWRVDNTCKAELDDVALKLQQDPDAKLVVVGNAEAKEVAHSKHKNLAGERAVDVKAYISGGEAKQNIDASRIETRTGNAGTMMSEQWIVPAGATFPEADSTTLVDETKVKPIPDHPKPAAPKRAAKKAQ
jgi:hypothetical protein